MTVRDTTVRSQSDSLAFEIDLPRAPDVVWRALTEPALLAEWLLPVFDLRLEPGAAFTFKRDPMPGWDGVVHCRILAVEAPTRISYSWVVGEIDTVVTFTLTATDTGTRLLLVQSGFTPDQKQNFGGARYGWTQMGQRLVDLIARMA